MPSWLQIDDWFKNGGYNSAFLRLNNYSIQDHLHVFTSHCIRVASIV